MNKPAVNALWLFTVFLLAAMFLPRIMTTGMFGDGLLYASLARNLAEGRGSVWAPFFSTGYFVPFASGNPYFENPPLMIWTQAAFFKIVGDFWWTEKLYSLLLFLLNAWLIVRLWEIPLRGTAFSKMYGWLPLLCWYFIPTVVWGNPNNLMDNQLLTFCLLASYCALDGLVSNRSVWAKMTLAGCCVYLGFMTKGPVALYPVAIPFLFAAIFSPNRQRMLAGFSRSAWIGLVTAGIFILMLAAIPEARVYFENYWEKRLGVVIAGTREDAALTGLARLSIFGILAGELAVLAVVALVIFLRRRPAGKTDRHRYGLMYLLVGLSATLPLVASARQSGMYILAGLPMFALSAGYFCLDSLPRLAENPVEKIRRRWRRFGWVSVAGIGVLCAYLTFIFGKPGREKSLIRDLPEIRELVPAGEKVAVCEHLMNDLHAHTYLQRFHKLELSQDFTNCRFAFIDWDCDRVLQQKLREQNFQMQEVKSLDTESFVVYLK